MRLLAITSLSPHYRLTIASLSPHYRRVAEWYFLRAPHPLHDQYAIVARTKWGVLALPGKPPPKEPTGGFDETCPKARVRARNVARFYVANFTAWSAFKPPKLDYDTWKRHCADLRQKASLGLAQWEDRDPEEREAARRNECYVLATEWDALNDQERKVACCKERFIAAVRLFTIDNVMCGFRAPKVGTCWADSWHVWAHAG